MAASCCICRPCISSPRPVSRMSRMRLDDLLTNLSVLPIVPSHNPPPPSPPDPSPSFCICFIPRSPAFSARRYLRPQSTTVIGLNYSSAATTESTTESAVEKAPKTSRQTTIGWCIFNGVRQLGSGARTRPCVKRCARRVPQPHPSNPLLPLSSAP